MKLEICCYSIHDALVAYQSGADRIEFCAGRSDGGLTPSYGQLQLMAQLVAQQQLPIPVHPIIRPRGGDFCYDAYDIASMQNDIALIKELGFAGVVLGCLTIDGQLDLNTLPLLIKAAGPLSITFHRAFDVCQDPQLVARQLADLGVSRILTSGQQLSAPKGLPLLAQLAKQDNLPIIMAGAGVRASNLQQFIDIGLQEFHASATKTIPAVMTYQNTAVKMGNPDQDEFIRYQADENEIKTMRQIIDGCRN